MRLFYLVILLLSACMEPNKPVTDGDIAKLVVHVDTYGEALDVDLTDSRMVKVEMKLDELEKDIGELNMKLMSLEDWLDEELSN